MAPKDYQRRHSNLIIGASVGFVAAVVVTLETWFAAGIIKQLLTWDTGIWPEWFPSQIPEFILSRWWAIIILVSFTLVGAIVGARSRRRIELL